MRFSIVALDKDDLSPRYLDKTNQLSGADLSLIHYNPHNNILVAAYANSTIDLIGPDGTRTLTDIKRRNDIIGDKTIYNIFFEADAAFLSCGFGLVKLDTKNATFEFTTFTNLKVKAFAKFLDFYYMATDEGIFRAPISGTNLLDFGTWETFGQQAGAACEALAVHQGKLYFNENETLWAFDGNAFSAVFQEANYVPSFLSEGKQKLIVGLRCLSDDCRGKVLLLHDDATVEDAALGNCYDFPIYAIEDEQQRLWFSDNYDYIRYKNKDNGFCQQIHFNKPYTELSYDMQVFNNALWIATGGTNANRGIFQFKRLGFMAYRNGFWEIHREANVPQLTNMTDAVAIAVNPSTGEVFTGFQRTGIARYDGQQYELLQGALDRISGLEFDDKNNLWISNSLADKPIAVRTPDGQIYSFESPQGISTLTNISIDPDGNKWFSTWGSNGLVVFNEGSSLTDASDDRYRIINNSNSVLPTSNTNCTQVDLEGNVWVGTANGAIVFECGSAVFDASSCPGRRPVVVRADGNNEYLLEGQNVTAIAVDGANRKWFGTTNGVFVQSANGREAIAAYNVDNSPLPDNVITALAINSNTGEVFIGTNNGIVSLQGEATSGGSTHKSQVVAFPNPVRPSYEGPIAIRGLPRDANVKITDVAGRLVYETKALGGQAVWDGKDYNGKRAASGVYLVFSTSNNAFDAPEALATKILIIN